MIGTHLAAGNHIMLQPHRTMLTLAVGTLVCLGCNSSDEAPRGGRSMEEMAAAVSAQRESKTDEAESSLTQQQPGPSEAAPSEPTRQVAEREGAGEGGYYTAIVGARRHVMNRVEDLAWIQGVQHFQAEHGRLPKDHDEFMSRIVEPLGIDLGYKEPDQEFLYDPSAGQWGEVYVVEKLDESAPQ